MHVYRSRIEEKLSVPNSHAGHVIARFTEEDRWEYAIEKIEESGQKDTQRAQMLKSMRLRTAVCTGVRTRSPIRRSLNSFEGLYALIYFIA